MLIEQFFFLRQYNIDDCFVWAVSMSKIGKIDRLELIQSFLFPEPCCKLQIPCSFSNCDSCIWCLAMIFHPIRQAQRFWVWIVFPYLVPQTVACFWKFEIKIFVCPSLILTLWYAFRWYSTLMDCIPTSLLLFSDQSLRDTKVSSISSRGTEQSHRPLISFGGNHGLGKGDWIVWETIFGMTIGMCGPTYDFPCADVRICYNFQYSSL